MKKITVKEKYYHFEQDGKKKTKCVLELENMDKFASTRFGINIIENSAFRSGKAFTKIRIPNKISATVTFKEDKAEDYDEIKGKNEARAAAYRKLDDWKADFTFKMINFATSILDEYIDEIFTYDDEEENEVE